MIAATVLSLVLITLTVMIHYVGLRGVAILAKRWSTSNYWVPPFLMFTIALLHLAEILLYALVYYLLHTHTNLGDFTKEFKPILRDYLYFSRANYTTLGMSDFYPVAHFKILAITEALAGFMMLTWSATFFYSNAGQFLKED